MRTVGIKPGERLTHEQQLKRVREFFQAQEPMVWGSGTMVKPDDFVKAEGQRFKSGQQKSRRQRDEQRLLK